MDFWLNDEQKMLRDNIRKFAEKELKPIINELDEREAFSPEQIKKLGELGLFGIFVPEEYGGAGMDYLSYGIMVEELSRIDISHGVTLAFANTLGIEPVYRYGSEEQKKKWLPRLTQGEILASYSASSWDIGSTCGGITMVLDGNDWIIGGHDLLVINASSTLARLCIVQAASEANSNGIEEISSILVESGTQGFIVTQITNKFMCRSADIGQVFFDNIKIPVANLLGKQGDGRRHMREIVDSSRLAMAAIALGGAQGANELALKYAKERIIFGKPISAFQVNAVKLTNMAVELETARNLLYKAFKLKDTGKDYGKEAAMAKLYCSDIMGRIVNEAVQLHGAYGLSKEYGVERFYRDHRFFEMGKDTSENIRNDLSQTLGFLQKLNFVEKGDLCGTKTV